MMVKIIQKLILIFHLDKRWIRIMLSTSLLIIFIIITIPIQHRKIERIKPLIYKVNDSIVVTNNAILRGRFDTVRLISNEFNVGDSVNKPVPPPEQQLDELTLKAEKPIDWKGTITWLIGAMNGLVLVVLNIKNLIFKKKD